MAYIGLYRLVQPRGLCRVAPCGAVLCRVAPCSAVRRRVRRMRRRVVPCAAVLRRVAPCEKVRRVRCRVRRRVFFFFPWPGQARPGQIHWNPENPLIAWNFMFSLKYAKFQ